MKRILILALVFISSVNSYAQSGSKECLYHIKFYNWQWDYCKVIGYDTIPKYSMYTGEHIGDTILWDTAFGVQLKLSPTLKYPLPDSFINSPQELIVTSFGRIEKLKVKQLTLFVHSTENILIQVKGGTIKKEDLLELDSVNPLYTFYVKIKLESGIDLHTPIITLNK